MTNQTNQDSEDKCKICASYEYFKYLIKESIPVEEAFHNVLAELTEELIEDVVDSIGKDFYTEGFDSGVIAGLRGSALELENIADTHEAEIDGECSCDEAVSPAPIKDNTEVLNCATCDCDEECVVEKYIRRAIWEDM